MGIVLVDLPCQRCGYNLRGIDAEGLCPECAAPVRFAYQGDLLNFADPAWLKTVLRGYVACRWAILLFIVEIVAFVSMFLRPVKNLLQLTRASVDFVWLLIAITPIAALTILSDGIWKLATPHPRTAAQRRAERIRLTLRGGLLATTALIVGYYGLFLVIGSPQKMMPYQDVMTLYVDLTLIAATVTGWAFARYSGLIAVRCGDRGAVPLAEFAQWGILISGTVLAVLMPMEMVGLGLRFADLAAWVALLGFLISVITLAPIAWKLSNSLAAIHRDAQRRWREIEEKPPTSDRTPREGSSPRDSSDNLIQEHIRTEPKNENRNGWNVSPR